MKISIHDDRAALGRNVAVDAAAAIRSAGRDRGRVAVVVATGSSQFEVLAELVTQPDVPW